MKRNVLKRIVLASSLAFFGVAAVNGAALAKDSNETNKQAISKLQTLKENYIAGVRQEAVSSKSPVPTKVASGPATMWLSKVNPKEVNMATNRHEKKAQKEIKLDGKTYYMTGDSYAFNMEQNRSTRFAKDPLTNKKIDKAEAVTFADASGRVHYFESEDTFRQFTALATPETVYGYSEAK